MKIPQNVTAKEIQIWLPCTGFLLTILTFFPSYLTPDSFDQYEQSLLFQFNDWHPSIMAFLWSLLNAIYTGPQPMLFLQVSIFWLGVHFLLSAIPTGSFIKTAIMVALLFSPTVLNFIGVIWKDVQLAAAWSFVAAYVFAQKQNGHEVSLKNKIWLILILIYGALIRHNAGLIAGPLVLYVITGRSYMAYFWKTTIAYILVASLSLGMNNAFNEALNASKSPATHSLMVFDLAGISLNIGENQYPFALSQNQMEAMRPCYHEGYDWGGFIWGDCGFIWELSKQMGDQNRTMRKAWIDAIINHPIAYMNHRLTHFDRLLGLLSHKANGYYIWQDGISPNKIGIETRKHGLYHLVKAYVDSFSSTWIFRPISWLILSLLLIFFSFFSKLEKEVSEFIFTMGIVSL